MAVKKGQPDPEADRFSVCSQDNVSGLSKPSQADFIVDGARDFATLRAVIF